jgi:DNA-directed RNA polymerase specialized sigma24 family protein
MGLPSLEVAHFGKRRVADNLPDSVAQRGARHWRSVGRARCWARDSAAARAVDAPRELIEDACQRAWTILSRRQPDRVAIFAWLHVVAIHDGYRLSRAERSDAHLGDLDHGDGWDAVIAERVTIDDAVEARRALRCLAELPDRQRRDLSLRVAGSAMPRSARSPAAARTPKV